MKIVTTGAAYIDIDSYGGCIAYAELLNLQGISARAASLVLPNSSVTPSLRAIGKTISAEKPHQDDEYIVIDISDPHFLDPMVDVDSVVEVIDHHPGHEEYWQEKLGNIAQIELVGAACTQIFERWEKAGKLTDMDAGTARLLAAGILDNTLNFTAKITTGRDHHAYAELSRIAGLDISFADQYFSECQESIEADLISALKNDTKKMDKPYVPEYWAQLVVWDAKALLEKDFPVIVNTLRTFGEKWGLNLISISESKSYCVAESPEVQENFKELFGIHFENSVSEPFAMMLRKEILKAALSK